MDVEDVEEYEEREGKKRKDSSVRCGEEEIVRG
jgi:hypothetical protein